MLTESGCSPLVWVTRVYAINPATVMMVFHGIHGELEVTLASGTKAVLNERDLTEDGRSLFIPPREVAATRPALTQRNETVHGHQ